MALPFLVVMVGIVGSAYVALYPAEARALSEALKGAFGPLGTAIVWGFSFAGRLIRFVTREVGNAILSSTALVVGWLGTLAKTVEHVATSALLWPVTLTRVLFWLLDVELPRLIHALPNAANGLFKGLSKRLAQLQGLLAPLVRSVLKVATKIAKATATAVLAPWLPALVWLRNHTHVLDGVLPRTLGLPSARDWANLKKRLRKLERLTGAGLTLGALAVALGRLGLGWVRCRKVGRVGRRICGMDDSLLDELLLGSLVIFSTLSIKEFAHAMRGVEDEAVGLLNKVVREWPDVPRAAK